MEFIRGNDWAAVADLLLDSARKLRAAGADFAICPDNTVHQAFPFLIPRSPIPFLHIADVVAEEAKIPGFRRLGILGTVTSWNQASIRPRCCRRESSAKFPIPRPGKDQRDHFKELVNGIFTESSRLFLTK